jgi:hypothetical protein
MATTGQKWLIGCSIGCGGVLVLLVVGLLAIGFVVNKTMQGFEQAEQSRDQIEQELGPGSEFTPEPDGSIPPDRMEIFLAVREATQDEREKLAESWQGLPLSMEEARKLDEQPFWEKLKNVFSITRVGFGMAGVIGDFQKARDAALLERGMGFGEYAYIYVIAYYSWLEHSVTDGPGKRAATAQAEAGADAPVGPDVGDLMGRDMAMEFYGGRVRDLMIQVLENQQQVWSQASDDPEAARWSDRLQQQIEAMNEGRLHVPWQDELPESIEASLLPYRERLEATYVRAANPFELSRGEEGGFSLNFP